MLYKVRYFYSFVYLRLLFILLPGLHHKITLIREELSSFGPSTSEAQYPHLFFFVWLLDELTKNEPRFVKAHPAATNFYLEARPLFSILNNKNISHIDEDLRFKVAKVLNMLASFLFTESMFTRYYPVCVALAQHAAISARQIYLPPNK